MENIDNILKGGFASKEESKIQKVEINWDIHAKTIGDIAKHLEPNFKFTKENKPVFKLLLQYFTGNEAFINNLEKTRGMPGSFNKGIMLVGDVGNGKSLIFKIFRLYTRDIIQANSFQDRTAIDIIDSVNISGVKVLEEFNHNMVDKIARPIRCYIDDIASKNEKVNNYGTAINVIEQLLSIRYNIFSRYGTLTHVSTNKFPSEMKELYDKRVIDRMKEMFNIIELNGKSFRK